MCVVQSASPALSIILLIKMLSREVNPASSEYRCDMEHFADFINVRLDDLKVNLVGESTKLLVEETVVEENAILSSGFWALNPLKS